MAATTALLSQPPSLSKILTNPLNSRPQSTSLMNQKLCLNQEKSHKISCNYPKPTSENASPMLNSVETTQFGKGINAVWTLFFSFYVLINSRVESRKPERYSSAAPLSRICAVVSERVDIIDNLIISVLEFSIHSICRQERMECKDVADSVLSYKSALRVTSAERKAESQLLETVQAKLTVNHIGTMNTLSGNHQQILFKNQTYSGAMLL
ncbi:hypothetical protein MKX03_015644 [Papaver bracteatum]|nr:hypothetical protein MKX03_015644 [Papaver bracteatum]